MATTRTTGATRTNPIVRIVSRLRHNAAETISELRKVAWPDSQTTRNLTLVVVGISTAIGFLLGLTDSLLTFLYTLLEKL